MPKFQPEESLDFSRRVGLEKRLGDLELERGGGQIMVGKLSQQAVGEVAFGEFTLRDIDRDRRLGSRLPQRAGEPTGLLAHLAAQLDDQPRLLGHRDEPLGRDGT